MKYQIFIVMMVISVYSAFGIEKSPIITYYGEIGCSHCDLFEEKILPEIERNAGVTVELKAFDILNPVFYEECETKLNELGLI